MSTVPSLLAGKSCKSYFVVLHNWRAQTLHESNYARGRHQRQAPTPAQLRRKTR